LRATLQCGRGVFAPLLFSAFTHQLVNCRHNLSIAMLTWVMGSNALLELPQENPFLNKNSC
jgi:hypothetical protein